MNVEGILIFSTSILDFLKSQQIGNKRECVLSHKNLPLELEDGG
jgi:hypothetical protein